MTHHTKHHLQFSCDHCQSAICFSVLERDPFSSLSCSNCNHQYRLEESLLVQLRQFEALCRQIQASKSILGRASIAVDIAEHHVRVPFNLLLTRLSSVIDLCMNGKKISIAFRVEPLKDCPEEILV